MVVVRSRYIAGRGSRGKGVGKALAHLTYIQHRPGPDREQGGRDLFSDLEDRVDATDVRKEIRQMGNQKVVIHKMTLAPEINPADKKAFTREVLGELGRVKGLDLKWYAVEHDNTEHHHVHVVIYGKDRNGTDVKIDKKDLEKVRELGDRYLEREHPRELEQAREERRRRQKEKQLEWERERQQRISEGLELPFIHKKILREQLEPYDQWRKKQDLKEQEREQAEKEKGKRGKKRKVKAPAKEQEKDKEKVLAAGQEWSRENSLKELRDLTESLWDNFEKRISKNDYKKLASWIKEKEQERLVEKDSEREEPEPSKKDKSSKKNRKDRDKDKNDKERDYFEHGGEKYSVNDSYERLTELAKDLRDNSERLPFESYQKLRGWIEDKDRSRWVGALARGLEQAKSEMRTPERPRTMERAGGEVVNPLQVQLTGNPVFRLFMAGAGLANELVRSIPVTENRDRLKETREDMEKSAGEIDEKLSKELSGTAYEEKAKGQRKKLDKALGETKEGQKTRDDQTKKDQEQQERDKKDREWFERGGGWGQ